MARAARRSNGRKPTRLGLRSLAAFVALLLLGSSLGQIAHFLLVQHAVCAEHGELLELHQGDRHASEETASHAESEGGETSNSGSDAEGEHDHCQLLARQQREQALPAAQLIAIAPAVSVRAEGALEASKAPAKARAQLSLAPKTSPPRHAAFG